MVKAFYYGGQAVIECVMMRGKSNLAISVRRPDGKLEIIKQPLTKISQSRLREIPLIRGGLILIETLVLGIQALFCSAQIASSEEEGEISTAALWGTVAAGIALSIALFFLIPHLITRLFDIYVASNLISNLIEGAVRIGIFILYLKVIGLLPDIKRIFAYHGAEHKVINAYEDGCPLELEAVKGYSTAHARCGTSFIFAILIIAILVFSLLGRPALWLSILSRIVLLPVIAIIGYEITRLAAKHSKSTLAHILLSPGLMLQSMTTREPDDSQLETAISALSTLISADTLNEPENYAESSDSRSL